MFLVNVEHQNIGLLEGLLFSVVAILIVFVVLVLIILCVNLLSKIKFKEKAKPAVAVAQSVKKLTIDDIKDEDMMVAALIATAEFVEETKEKDARLVSIKQIG